LKPSCAAADFERRFVQPAAGRTLIVGSLICSEKPDRRRLYPDVLGVDMRPGPGVDRVLNLEDELPPDIGTFRHVECCSVLEHSRRPWLLAANVERLLEPGGTLYFSVPFIWRYHDYPGDLWRFTHEGVIELFPQISWERLMYASNKLRPDHYSKAVELEGHPYMPRSEVVGFGVRK
jgi:SAM-dependent methyltransferase